MIRLLAVLACLLLPAVAHAWSANGHRTVAYLAAAELTPAARAQVALLLAGEADPTLPGIAAWADRLRDDDPARGEATAPWHYVKFEPGCAFDAATCKGGDCVIGAINRNYLVLSDPRRPRDARRDALKFLVHFVGDVHQPLHASPRDDKGGNDDQVNWQGKGSNLHRVWDRTILESRGLDPVDYAAALRRPAAAAGDASLRSQSPAVDWAVESCRLVASGRLDPPRRVLDQAYIETGRLLAEQRLVQAGHRLAAMLNHALR
ncbi:MAG TPA: S1/P1 nuclease [Luteimonas sp.]|nr:S1/P1 nuclease [Luteimonas sp.]